MVVQRFNSVIPGNFPGSIKQRIDRHSQTIDARVLDKTMSMSEERTGLNELHYYTESEAWHALYCKSRAEKKVYEAIEHKIVNIVLPPIRVFLPLQRVRSRWSDRVKEIERPLFPGYILIKTHMNNVIWRELIITPGVSNLLHVDNKPLIIPQSDIDLIEKLIASSNVFSPCKGFQRGQHVIVKHGALEGVEGILQEINPRTHRLIVNFPLLNRSVRTSIDPLDIELV